MHEFFIEEEKLEGLLQLASEKTGISKRELQEKLSGVMQDGKIVVNEQIYGLLSDPKKLEMLLNSGIVGRLFSGDLCTCICICRAAYEDFYKSRGNTGAGGWCTVSAY